jgi:anaphase-promoting complex subunit 7
LKDVSNKYKAKPLLSRALELNENYLPAVFMLAELLQDESDSAGAIKLLKKQISVQPNCKLHSMLGDILINCDKDHTGALENYTIALK